jgi:hypothetical protein
MKLATELNQANGFDAVVVINEMELLYDKHVAELKNLSIHDVSNRRELLLDFMTYTSPEVYATHSKAELADNYLSSNSC